MRQVYDNYASMVGGVARRYVGSRDADDVTQSVFVNVFTHIDTFAYRGEGSLGAWIRRIAINQAIMVIRQRARTTPIDPGNDIPEPPPPDTSRLTAAQILGCLEQLPLQYRTIFQLHVVDGLSHDEIAQMLSIQANASMTRLSRAKKLLAQIIIDTYGTEH